MVKPKVISFLFSVLFLGIQICLNANSRIFNLSPFFKYPLLPVQVLKAERQNLWHYNFKQFSDTTKKDSLRFPIYDRRGDYFSNSLKRNPFDFSDTAFIKRDIQYDPIKKEYFVSEKIGSSSFRVPVNYSQSELLNLKGKADESNYFKSRFNTLADMNRQIFKPNFTKANKDWFNRIVGNGKIEIKPTGYIEMFAGYRGQVTNNPTLPERARNNGGPDFDMNTKFNLDANIGDKIKLPINYNTQAFSQLENKLNFNYEGKQDEILKQFQLGNTSFATKSSLIPKAQSLFGVKTQLQFGKLTITGVLANQRAERQSLQVQGGQGSEKFEIKADNYDENRHFLLAQYFRNNFNRNMRDLPRPNSQVRILRLEVWVTNRTGFTTDNRDIVGLMDLGEGNPYHGPAGNPNAFPDNNANGLYNQLKNNPQARNSATAQSALTGMGYAAVRDYEKTFARKLNAQDYIFNPEIGFVSLSVPLISDEVLAVAYQYTYRGRTFQVGEFSQDVPPDSTAGSQKVLFLKLLKATSQRTSLPIWDLMMKNVYSVGAGQLDSTDFKIDVVYEEPGLGTKRYLPPTAVLPAYEGKPLLTLLNLDRLNNQNDPQPDGIYDFINGYTIIPSMSRIIFPMLEPFGHDLDYAFKTPAEREKYLFYPLYDTIKVIAKTYANVNRFELIGKSKTYSSSQGDYQLGYGNIPPGGVTVTAGGQYLKEGTDYVIDYDAGSIRVVNDAIVNSGVPVNIQYENQNINSTLQQRNYMGLRLDYAANKHFSLGGTMVRLGERPYFIKTQYGEDPIKNTVYGLDLDYNNDWPRLTKWLDKLPNYSTKAPSSVKFFAEGAYLDPGHPKQIGKGAAGLSYLDDFEGTRTEYDLRFPFISWQLASVPQNDNFPESALNNNLSSGYRRGKLAFYNIEPVLYDFVSDNNPLKGNINDIKAELSKPQTRQVRRSEIFPQVTTDFGQGLLTTFDIAYYPKERGPYNFENRIGKLNADGTLVNPSASWAGISRSLDQTDFESNNIEFVEFWVQDPFIDNPLSKGGTIHLNLGNIAEDILKDGKRQFENGLPTPKVPAKTDTATVWGKVPANPLQITNGFNVDPDDRKYQDVGYDGLTDDEEQNKFTAYLNTLLITAPLAFENARKDPSADNFVPYRDPSYAAAKAGILQRYKNINNPSGNSPVINNSQFVTAQTQYPDAEELNRDNTMIEREEYFNYDIKIEPFMQVGGNNFITDIREVPILLPNGQRRTEKWYLFRVPIAKPTDKVGEIPDFKSIRFMRLYLTDFEDSIVMRFGKLSLIGNNWRKFQYKIDTTGQVASLPSVDLVDFNQLAVNIEENDQRSPVRYVTPPGILRQQQLSNTNVQLYQNEQALSMQVCDLPLGESRGVFKNQTFDMRQYGSLNMFIHVEGKKFDQAIEDNTISAVVRLANDFQGNFYEVKIPLKKTIWNATDSLSIWPEENNLDIDLKLLVKLKEERNRAGIPASQYYKKVLPDGRTIALVGNPNLAEIHGILLAAENTNSENACFEIWFNELRFGRLDEKGGWAATARADIALADLGTITGSITAKTFGFGDLENRVNNRLREDLYNFDLSASLDAGRLLPKKWGIQLPVYAGFSKIISNPEYDPYDQDILLTDKINSATSAAEKSRIRSVSSDVTTIKTLNFTNVRFALPEGKVPMPWSISNFDLNYSYINSVQHNPLLENEELTRSRGTIGYNYAPPKKTFTPFAKLKSKSPWMALIKDFNINYLPSQLTFKADVFRQFGASKPRNVFKDDLETLETFNKYFTFDRYYTLQWSIFDNLNIDYSATNYARIDEPFGRIDSDLKKDAIRKNLLKGGRNTHFLQQITTTYKLPLEKIPALNWTSLSFTVRSGYDWLSTSLLTKDLGNTISNTQTRDINGELNFDQLYNKSRFFKAVQAYQPQPKVKDTSAKKPTEARGQYVDANKKTEKALTKKELRKKKRAEKRKPIYEKIGIKLADWDAMDDKAQKQAKKAYKRKQREERRRNRLIRRNELPEINGADKFIGDLATALKSIKLQYNEDMGTLLPGYLDSTKVLGANLRSGQPGAAFIFGYQPDTAWISRFGRRGLLSSDSVFTSLIQQRFTQHLKISARVEPFRDFNIEINFEKTFSKQFSESYKDTLGTGGGLAHLNPYTTGSFEVTYIAYKTLFRKVDPTVPSVTFERFQQNREEISRRLALSNPYHNGGKDPNDPSFYAGYGRYAQDVIIPAFITAYTRSDPSTFILIKNGNPNSKSNPFSGIVPKPNWTINYSGLSRIPGMERIFTDFNLRHGYNGSLSMNSFNSALLFKDPNAYGMPAFQDSSTGNYVPYFLVPNITIREGFEPLIGIDMTFTNKLSTKFEYAKSRTLSLSLIDYQLAETNTTNISAGFSWRKKGVPFLKNVRIGRKGLKLDNDLTFTCNFTIRDDVTANSKLDQGNSTPTYGSRTVRFDPTIQYILNKSVSLRFFYDYQKTTPKISNSFPITNTRTGVTVRVALDN